MPPTTGFTQTKSHPSEVVDRWKGAAAEAEGVRGGVPLSNK